MEHTMADTDPLPQLTQEIAELVRLVGIENRTHKPQDLESHWLIRKVIWPERVQRVQRLCAEILCGDERPGVAPYFLEIACRNADRWVRETAAPPDGRPPSGQERFDAWSDGEILLNELKDLAQAGASAGPGMSQPPTEPDQVTNPSGDDGVAGQPDTKVDTGGKNRLGFPESKNLNGLIHKLKRDLKPGVTRKSIAEEYCQENRIPASDVPSLLRQARRYKHLYERGHASSARTPRLRTPS
jgi:hypothetical protein